jgi:hypothetical protein
MSQLVSSSRSVKSSSLDRTRLRVGSSFDWFLAFVPAEVFNKVVKLGKRGTHISIICFHSSGKPGGLGGGIALPVDESNDRCFAKKCQ